MRSPELLEILRNARALVAEPARWTERNYAEGPAGEWVPVGSPNAARFNLAGAVMRCAGSSTREAMTELTKLLAPSPPELHSEQLTLARGLPRRQALALLDWAMARLQ